MERADLYTLMNHNMNNVGSFCATQIDMGTLADSEGHSQRFPSFDLHAATNCSNKIV